MKEADKRLMYQQAFDLWGVESQVGMLIEECCELIISVRKLDRKLVKITDVFGEIADVRIMLEQIEYITNGKNDIDIIYKKKLERLKQRIHDTIKERTST